MKRLRPLIQPFVKPALGALLLAGLVWSTDLDRLLAALKAVSAETFGLALLAAILANLVCVRRWQLVGRSLHVPVRYNFLLATYAQGISANSVLPGGVLGGDVWRSVALAEQAPEGHKAAAPASVFLDRVSGFWGLAWVSLTAGLWVWASGLPHEASGWLIGPLGLGYLAALLATLVAPILLAAVGRPMLQAWVQSSRGLWHRACSLLLRIAAGSPQLVKTLGHSVVAQLLTMLAFGLCLAAAGLEVPVPVLMAVCGGIFLSGVLPASIGGFGARELGAVAFLAPLGFDESLVLAGSVLFGLTATAQGLLGLVFWFGRRV